MPLATKLTAVVARLTSLLDARLESHGRASADNLVVKP